MARHPHIVHRPGSQNWYYRRRVPSDLVEFIGKHDVWRSLRTPDLTLATRRSKEVAAQVEASFASARQRRDAVEVPEVPDAELVAAAQSVFREQMALYEPQIIADPNNLVAALDAESEEWVHGVRGDHWAPRVEDTVADALKDRGLIVPRDSKSFAIARHLIARAWLAAVRTAQRRAEGDFGFVFGAIAESW